MVRAGQVAAAGLVLLTAACSGGAAVARPSGAATSPGLVDCGIAYTAANVPVHIQVPAGAVACSVALRVEADYARKLSAGLAPGNGGGGPVPVDGWICAGYPTPQVLRTGRASQCTRGSVQIAAILPTPGAAVTP